MWGVILLVTTLAVVVPFMLFVNWSQSLRGRVVVTGNAAPPDLVAQSSGRLRLLVRDRQRVRGAQPLAIVGSDADIADVARAGDELRAVVRAGGAASAARPTMNGLMLGELAPELAEVRQNAARLRRLEAKDPAVAQIAAARSDLAALRELARKLGRQRELLGRDLTIAEKKLALTQKLLKEGLTSAFVVSDFEATVLQKRYAVETLLIEIVNNDVRITEKQAAVSALEQTRSEERINAMQELEEAAGRALARLKAWEQAHVVLAPVDGEVSLHKYWSENQYVRAGDEIMSLVPASQRACVGRVLLSEEGAASVRSGQIARVRFEAYPVVEFGVVEGRVESMSAIPREGKYAVEIGFPVGLTTNEGKKLPLLPNMQGAVEIITSKRTFLSRILQGLKTGQ
jgi:hypothetical protein